MPFFLHPLINTVVCLVTASPKNSSPPLRGATIASGDAEAVILHSNGMLSVGQSVPHACVQALFLEETAQLQLAAQAAGMKPKFYSPESAARRHGDDRVHEPIRAWEYYVGVVEGRMRVGG